MSVTSERSYTAFGLVVHSEIDLPELTAPSGESTGADVSVRYGTVDLPADADPDDVVSRTSETDYYLTYEAASVRVRGGREIVVDPVPDVPREIIRHLVLGPAFNHLLHQRDYLVLHAGSVVVDGVAVAFVGESGAGKTTTAAAFLAAGCPVLSDDVAAVIPGSDPPRVRNGYPSLKLDPSLVEQFDLPVEDPTDTTPHRDRHFYGLREAEPVSSVPLGAVYVLSDSERLELLELAAPDQVTQLVEHTYTGAALEGGDEVATNFRRCSSLAQHASVKRLERPRELARLPDVVERVRADVAAETEP